MSRTVFVYRIGQAEATVYSNVLFDRTFGGVLLLEHGDGRRIYLGAGTFDRVVSVVDQPREPVTALDLINNHEAAKAAASAGRPTPHDLQVRLVERSVRGRT